MGKAKDIKGHVLHGKGKLWERYQNEYGNRRKEFWNMRIRRGVVIEYEQ